MAKINVAEINGDTAKRDYIRNDILLTILSALQEKYGKEFTRHLPYDITVCPDDDTEVDIKKNKIILEAADVTDKDGFEVGAIAEIGVSIRKWNPVYSKKDNITHSAVTLPDIDEALTIAEEKAKASAEKKRMAEEKKQKKIAADTARRAKRAEKAKENGE